ncbi:TonB-dependent receptor domain-containing protein [Marinobacter sp. F4206]|uniref:TonB-dependent receptor domain-containing protein n=1 Tax=Marinobacter sp. F4206 TaxID=2861777 RepID=UPI0027E5792C|nr:TonB-dependent receptor [Marinobacter sp. F4206]
MMFLKDSLPNVGAGVILSSLPLVSGLAMAEQSSVSGDATELDPIVVTATLGPRTVGESLSSVTVLDEDTVESQAPNEFADLLRGQPGVTVVSNGAFGKNTSVYTRGTSNDSTVLLLDGIRIRSATSGGAPWQFVPKELIERVEIVRGPRSSLYGADAVGGVIQAFTLRPEAGPRGWIEAGGGSFDTRKGAAGVSLGDGVTSFSVSGVHKNTDGTELIEGGEDRGFRNSAGVARLSHTLPNGGEAGVSVFESRGNTEFEGGNTDFTLRAVGFSLNTPLSDYWRTRIDLNEARDEQETANDAFADSVFNTRTRTARWENTFTRDVHELVLGSELSSDEVKSSTGFDETSRNNAALFGQLRLNFGPTDVQVSLRGDDNEAYGREETGGVALGHAFDRSHRIRVSYGTSFRAPTFNDLYYPLETYSFGGSYAGNPDLKPEESSAVELGFSGRYPDWFWDVAAYQLDIDNLIALSGDGAGNLRPENVNEAEIRGLELGAGFERGGWRTHLALTLTDARDAGTDNRLRRRSGQGARLDIDRDINTWTLGGTLVAEGYRYDDAANTKRLPGYGTLDLRAIWRFAPDWTGKLSVTDVFDRTYATAERFDGRQYLSAGRTAMASIRYEL